MKCVDVRRELVSYISGELDAAGAAAVEEHVGQCDTCAARLTEIRNLSMTIRDQGIEPMPDALEARIRERIPRREPISLPPLFGSKKTWAAALALAVVIAFLGALLVSRQGPSAAAEAVARAERKMRMLSSYHISWLGTSYSEDSTIIGTQKIEQWAKAPGLVRMEMTGSDTYTHRSSKVFGVIQSDRMLWVDTDSHVAAMWPPSQEDEERTSSMLRINLPAELLRRHQSTMRLVGTAHVLGREGDIIEENIGGGERIQYTFDRTTGLLLRMALYNGNRLMLLDEATELEVDKPIANELFDATPPKGMQVIKGPVVGVGGIRQWGDADKAAEALANDLAELLGDKRYPLGLDAAYTPSYLPDGYVYQGVRWLSDASKEPVNGATPRYGITIIYIKPDTGDTLLVTETNQGEEVGDREVTVQGVAGRIKYFEKPFPYLVLRWSKEDVHFKVEASDMSEGEVLRVAESLQQLNP